MERDSITRDREIQSHTLERFRHASYTDVEVARVTHLVLPIRNSTRLNKKKQALVVRIFTNNARFNAGKYYKSAFSINPRHTALTHSPPTVTLHY